MTRHVGLGYLGLIKKACGVILSLQDKWGPLGRWPAEGRLSWLTTIQVKHSPTEPTANTLQLSLAPVQTKNKVLLTQKTRYLSTIILNGKGKKGM